MLTLALVGCATASGPVSAPPPPGGPKTSANVRVYRDTPPEDDLFRMDFTVNGNSTYQLRPGERYDFELAAGSYQFGYRMGTDNCTQDVQIDRGGNYVFKLGSACNIELESE
ncbi:MAG: hypothetical protein WCA32_09935 [Chromatiaceae bacterium]